MTNELKINDTIPTFVLPLSDDTLLDSKELKKKLYIIYFYPKDNTPGCTNEAKDFSSNIEEFKKNNVEVIGVSKGGSDQWGNIVCGIDLARRLSGVNLFGLTTPLLTTSSS